MQIIKKSLLKKSAIVASCLFACVGGLAGTYFLVPKKSETIDLGNAEFNEAAEETYFQKFVTRLTGSLEKDVKPEDAYPALSADLKDFEISWPSNTVKIDGNLKLSLKGLNNINLSLDANVDYNGKKVDLGVGFVDKTVYLAIKDLRLKQSFVETEDLNENDIIYILDKTVDNFFNTANPDGLQINFGLDSAFDSLLSGIDLSSLTNGVDLKIDEKVEGNDVTIKLDVGMPADEGKEPTNLSISLVIDKDTLGLKKADLGTIKLGDVTIKGKLDCTCDNVKIIGLDDPNYPVKRGDFVEIINYSSWIDKIFNLLQTRQIGLDINADLKMHEADGIKNLGYLNLCADLDASELFDLKGFNLNGLLKGEDVGSVIKADPTATPDQNEIISLLNRFDFNIGIDLGNIVDDEKVAYSNLGLAYLTDALGHNAGYLSLNEEDDDAVMRAKIDVETINYLISEVPNLINSIDEKKAAKAKRSASGEEETEAVGFFDLVTSSELVTAIKDGKYDGIIDLIKSLKSTNKTIELVVGLSTLGFGEDSTVTLVLDASDDAENEPTKVISIKAEKVMLNDLELNAEIYTRPYDVDAINHVFEIADKYDTIDFVPGVFEQVQSIINTEQAAISLDGSILDSANLGFNFGGWAQLDYSQLNGMGSITFNEYKSDPKNISNNHKVDISIDDFDAVHAKNNMLFQYSNPKTGDGTPLRGKFTLKTFDDIIDLVMKLIKEQDRRFMKFLDDILAKLRASILVTILTSKDYLQLSKSSFVKKIAQNENGDLDIIISKTLIPLDLVDSDIHLRLTFKNDAKNQKCLKGISVVDLAIGEKTVNANINLDNYNSARENPVDTEAKFMDFSDIAVLLEFGINTMELNVYHLTGNAHVGIINIDVNLDFYVYVNGETTKVYGIMKDLPKPSLTGLFCTMNSEFVFEPNHDASNNDIGGYFYILRDEDHWIPSMDKQYYFKTDSKSFVDKILDYLLYSLLGSSEFVGKLGNLDLSSGKEVNPAYENMFIDKGFVYTKNDNVHKWDIGIDLGILTDNSSFSNLTATLTGKETNGLGYYTDLHAETVILVISLNADIHLDNPDPEVKNWPSSVEKRYQKIVSFYDTLSASNKAAAYNNPRGGYSCKRGTI